MFGGTYSQIEALRIMVVSSRGAFRLKMKNLLSSRTGYHLIQNVSLSEGLIEVISENSPQILLIDPVRAETDLDDLLVHLKRRVPGTISILVSEDVQPWECRNYFSVGVMGILPPDFSPNTLGKAIEAVRRGEHWISRKMAGKVFSEIFGQERPREAPVAQKHLLTKREQEILTLVSRGYQNKEIGESLFISEKTVKTHLTNIFGKLKIKNRLQAALYARRNFPEKDPVQFQPAI